MVTRRNVFAINSICTLALLVLLAACGGGGGSTPSHFEDDNGGPQVVDNIDNDNTGGTGTNTNNGGGTSPGPTPQPITGALPSAPLGTNPKYQVREFTPIVFGSGSGTSSVKTPSVFGAGEWAAITMTEWPKDPDTGEYVDPSLIEPSDLNWDSRLGDGFYDPDSNPSSPFRYKEGTKVILWLGSMVYSPSGIPTTFNVPELWYQEEHELVLDPSSSDGIVYLGLPLTLPFLRSDSDGNTDDRICHYKLWMTTGFDSQEYGWRYGFEQMTPMPILNKDPQNNTPTDLPENGIEFAIYDDPNIISTPVAPTWVLAWETTISEAPKATYDYNNVVMGMYGYRFEGPRNGEEDYILYGFDIVYKGVACGDGNSGQWQFDIENEFDAFNVQSIVHELQFNTTSQDGVYPDGVYQNGNTRRYASSNGVDIPVFTPDSDLMPSPPGLGSTTNTELGDMWSTGGCAWVQINFGDNGTLIDPHAAWGDEDYIPLPCSQTMYVNDPVGSDEVLVIRIDTGQVGGNGNITKDSFGRPLGFLLKNVYYDWMMDPVKPGDTPLNNAYELFDAWVAWLNGGSGSEPVWWTHKPYEHTDPLDLFPDVDLVPYDSEHTSDRINNLLTNPMYAYTTPPSLAQAYYFNWDWLGGFSPGS